MKCNQLRKKTFKNLNLILEVKAKLQEEEQKQLPDVSELVDN